MATADADAQGQEPGTDALIGKTVGGRFHVTERIARGGMACVYFATQQPLNRPAAIKVLRADGGAEDQESFRRRFLLEASMLSQLQHPNIVTLLDYGQIDDLPGDHYFMAMEYLHGETLGKRLKSRGVLSVVETLRIARQIGRGLREAHRRGFVHRDLKPSNIMLVPEDDQNDIVKLVDFGIGKVVTQPNTELVNTDEEDMTRVGLMLGSPRHMAPEQIRGDAIEPRTDLYGLGVVLFQLLSGRLPFDGRSEVDILVSHCSIPAPKLNEAYPDRFIPASLSDLVDSLLKKQASQRPTIYEFLLKLADIEDEVFGALGMAGPTLSQRPTFPPSFPSVPRAPLASFSDHPSERPTAPNNGVPLGAPESLAPSSTREALESQSFVTPLTSAPRRKKRVGIVVGLVFCFVGALIAVLAWPRDEMQSTPVVSSSTATAHLAALAPKPAPSTFSLTIDSVPSGANLNEGSILLGKTPLTVFVEHTAVAETPRHFSIEREGFVPYQFEQGDSTDDVNVVAKLKAKSTTSSTVAASARVRTEVVKVPIAPTAHPIKGDDSLEIRTRR
ncbi:MAG: serine/threonine-protein kinase [Myxococcales bacterium]